MEQPIFSHVDRTPEDEEVETMQARKCLRAYWAENKRKQRSRLPIIGRANSDALDQRTKQKICQSVIDSFQKETQGMSINTRRDIFQQLLQHPCFLSFQDKTTLVESALVSNFCNTLNQVKIPRSSNELFMKKSALLMLVNGEGTSNNELSLPKAAKVLGIHKRNLYLAKSNLFFDEDGSLPLSTCQRQVRTSHISQEVKDLIVEFWTKETRVSPNKKDVCRKRMEVSAFVKHPIHLLEEPQIELYLRFKSTYSEIQISQRSFERLKPFFVRKLKDRYTCCCIVHVQMTFLRDAFNQMRSQQLGIHGLFCGCTCNVCQTGDSTIVHGCLAPQTLIKSVTSLWSSLLCVIPNGCVFHAYKCVMGQCDNCGVLKLAFCPREIANQSSLVSVKLFENFETGVDEEGKKKKIKDIALKKIFPGDLLELCRDHLRKFIVHNFLYRWQANQYSDCIATFPDDVVVSVVDFAENYSFKEQNEIQSMHWYSKQVTIFVHITYFRIASGRIKKTVHFFISDDKIHDTAFVQHCFLLHVQWLNDLQLSFKRHWVWSDGAASQFKAKRPFYFVARYWQLTGMEMTWNFFCSGHGKGEHDGQGAVVKRALEHEQLKADGARLTCAVEVIDFARKHLSNGAAAVYDKQKREVSRVFWEIKEGDVKRFPRFDCKTIKGSRSLHCVNGYSQTATCALRYKQLSCFCNACIKQQWARCKNRSHVQMWQYHTLEPLDNDENSSSDYEEDGTCNGPTYSGHADILSDALSVGDNFVVPPEEGNEEEVDFYLLKCASVKERTTRDQRDAWGNNISKNTFIIKAHWYKCLQNGLYELWDNRPIAFIYSHLIRAIKFDMEPIEGTPRLYRLCNESHEAIYNNMPYEL